MTVLDIVRLIGDEFNGVSDAEIATWTEFVRPLVSRNKFGNLYDRAVALLVCHNLKMSGKGNDSHSDMIELSAMANSAGIGSISDGGSSISFNGSRLFEVGASAEYSRTLYGQQYINLVKLTVIPITIHQ